MVKTVVLEILIIGIAGHADLRQQEDILLLRVGNSLSFDGFFTFLLLPLIESPAKFAVPSLGSLEVSHLA